MRSNAAFWETFALPEGFVLLPAPDAPGSIDSDMADWLRRGGLTEPVTEAEIADAVARVDRHAGSISIGRPPRRSDWRCRGRYNEGDCDDA